MGTAFLEKKGGGGLKIDGVVEEYYVHAGETIKTGDFVNYIEGSNAGDTETQVKLATVPPFDGVALSGGNGGNTTAHKDKVKVSTAPKLLSSLPVGSLVRDTSSTFLGKPVIWKVADVNHEGYPDNSVTLITEKSVAMRCFDESEPNNSDEGIQRNGYNRYSVSNIRQWLNSDAEAGQWYSPQHSVDQPPNVSYHDNNYVDDAGFLNGFSENLRNSLLDTEVIVALNTVTDGGGSETIIDKIFLPSRTEVGLTNTNSISEGKLLPMFSDNESRVSYCTTEAIEDSDYPYDPENDTIAWDWLLRSPASTYSHTVTCISETGHYEFYAASSGMKGVRPLCNLPSSIKVSKTPDANGIYDILF